MFVVTNNGERLHVDDSVINYDDGKYHPFQQLVGLYDDSTILRPVWILQLQKDLNILDSNTMTLELVKEIKYRHKPTQEEILWAMSANGLSRYDVVTISEGYELDMEYD